MNNKLCSQCGKLGLTHTHHIDYDHDNNNPENRQRLCPKCHALAYKPGRIERINKEMRERRESEYFNYIDQSTPGWSRGMTWDELLEARQYGRCYVR